LSALPTAGREEQPHETRTAGTVRHARKELRKASGQPLTAEEQNEELRNTAVAELHKFMLRHLGVSVLIELMGEATWTEKGPAAVLKAENHIFHLRKEGDGDSYALFIIDGDVEREIARIEAHDPCFANRVLVAIDEAVPPIE